MSKRRTHLLRATLIITGSDKGGVSKTFTTTLIADLLDVGGILFRLVQIDDQTRLPALYPGQVTTVPLATLDELRRDPSTLVSVFDPLYAAIEQSVTDGVITLVDVGGPQQMVLEQYLGLVDIDADLTEAGLRTLWVVPTTAEQEAIRGAVRTARAVGRVLPSAQRVLVLNERDGPFRFYPGSPTDCIWRDDLEPLCQELGSVCLPAIAPGSWQPFEAAGRRFTDVVSADIPKIQGWTGRSRPAAKVARGDVAAFLASAQEGFAGLLGLDTENGDAE